MGVVNSVMNVIIDIWGMDETLRWCQDNYIIRRGYHGGQFDGNNCKKILIDPLCSFLGSGPEGDEVL